jgi:hypothetical protein
MNFYFSRANLGQAMLDDLLGKTPFGDAANGYFLAAPRRTGKSSFLKNDLQPLLQSANIAVIYVDLWIDKNKDPASLIADAIGKEIVKNLGFVAKTAKSTGLESISVGGMLKIDTSKIGQYEGVTLHDALNTLQQSIGKPIALIIDEAQHALTSRAGEDAMTALKSARDQMNVPGNTKLMLIMSGSDRDKLLRLVNSNSAPFFGSSIKTMPLLGTDFIHHVTQMIEHHIPQLKQVDETLLMSSFKLFGNRPQFFTKALGEVLNPLNNPQAGFETLVCDLAKMHINDEQMRMASQYCGLRPLERAIIWRLLEQGGKFRPYDAEALQFYTTKTSSTKNITPAQVQSAIDTLRTLSPSMIWKSARGEYALDDAHMHDWYQERLKTGKWPPDGINETNFN